MLNPFPFFLAYGLLAPFIIRVVLGLIFVLAGYLKIFKRREAALRIFAEVRFPAPAFFMWLVALIELAGGALLVAGLWTQVAAMAIALISLGGLIIKVRRSDLLPQTVDFYVLTLVMSLSLVLSGAGAFAMDLPL